MSLSDSKTALIAAELVNGYSVKYSAGGAGMNTLRGVQKLLPEGATHFFGCIGEDEFGQKLEEAATKDGLEVHFMKDGSLPSGTCSTLLTSQGHHRTLVANLGVTQLFHKDYVAQEDHKQASFVFM